MVYFWSRIRGLFGKKNAKDDVEMESLPPVDVRIDVLNLHHSNQSIDDDVEIRGFEANAPMFNGNLGV